MNLKYTGFIKLYRSYLLSKIRESGLTVRACFPDLLLALEIEQGSLKSNISELTLFLALKDRKTTRKVLQTLEDLGAITVNKKDDFITITAPNWKEYQKKNSKKETGKNDPKGEEQIPSRVGNKSPVGGEQIPSRWGTNPQLVGNKSPVSGEQIPTPINRYANIKEVKEVKEGFKKGENLFLDFKNPKKELEILVAYFLQKTKDPVLKKSNEKIEISLKNDLPHFEVLLARTEDLNEAKGIIDCYIAECEGKDKPVNLFYLTQDLTKYRARFEKANSVRVRAVQRIRALTKAEKDAADKEKAEQERWNSLSPEERAEEWRKETEEIRKGKL